MLTHFLVVGAYFAVVFNSDAAGVFSNFAPLSIHFWLALLAALDCPIGHDSGSYFLHTFSSSDVAREYLEG